MTTGNGVAEVGLTLGAAFLVLVERGFAAVLALRALVLRAGFAGDLETVADEGMQSKMHLTLTFYRQGVDRLPERYTMTQKGPLLFVSQER